MSREIPLTRGHVSLVDDEDYAAVMAQGKWCAHVQKFKTYAAKRTRGADGEWHYLSLHAFILGRPWVDHINGDSLDNRRANLRPATAGQNNANRDVRRDSTSGIKGVRPYAGERWRAQISVERRVRHLGLFDTAEDAARAYDVAALAAWGEFARTNFPREDYAS